MLTSLPKLQPDYIHQGESMKTSYLPEGNEDKAKWAHVRGPWNDEPDRAEWRDEETGLPCIALRQTWSGHWCGYVGVSPGHPWHGKGYDDVAADVHGGLTFADKCQEKGRPECPEHRVCHVPEPGESDDVWWLGFDCAHCWDVSPYDRVRGRSWESPEASYKDLAYVRSECANLAKQAKAAA